ncbi:hypothetical protein [Oculatella sp. LEGE 06141]|nr:hypothetical protein [Oculatella sp. LEGE 06141]
MNFPLLPTVEAEEHPFRLKDLMGRGDVKAAHTQTERALGRSV